MRKKLDAEQIRQLPTLSEVVECLRLQEEIFASSGGWEPYCRFGDSDDWLNPMSAFCNNADTDKFIVTRTCTGRSALKPNLKHKPVLYRGENAYHPTIVSSFERNNIKRTREDILDDMLFNNLKTEEFHSLLRSHPLMILLSSGVSLSPDYEPFFFNMDYYGLCQHYGFKTGVVDFTSDVEVAAFFAASRTKDGKTWTVCKSDDIPYGTIYVYSIDPWFSFKTGSLGPQFSTIGLQLYPRSGAQKGVLWNGSSRTITESVTAFDFRHDEESDFKFYKKWDGGNALFPKDSLSPLVDEILDNRIIPGDVFATNLFKNYDDLNVNLERLRRKKASVDWNKRTVFTPETLHPFYMDLKNGLWEQFCNQIYFGGKDNSSLREAMLKLPENPHYSHYFKLNEWHRIQYQLAYELNDNLRNKNRKSKSSQAKFT